MTRRLAARHYGDMGIESFLPESVQLILMGAMAAVFVLSQAARRYPHVEWLRKFNLPDNRIEEQKRRARRSGNIFAGVEMILMGLAIPAVYLVMTVMFFSEMTTGELLLVGASSLLCIGFGIWAIAKSRTS